MRLQQHHPIRPRVVHLDQVEQIRHVAERLRHLLALSIDHEPVVHPVPGELAPQRHRLGPLVLVMRESQILATTVEVEAVTEQPERHHHTFGVPAGPPLTPR